MSAKFPRGPDGDKFGKWWQNEGNVFLTCQGKKFVQLTFSMFRERVMMSDVIAYDFRHMWTTWIGNHKVGYDQISFS